MHKGNFVNRIKKSGLVEEANSPFTTVLRCERMILLTTYRHRQSDCVRIEILSPDVNAATVVDTSFGKSFI